jgi:O-antigen ligase
MLNIIMVLTRSSENRLQRWASRAIAAFLAVWLLGSFGVPTFIPYIAVVIAVVVDGVRLALRRRDGVKPTHDRTETIH